MGPERADFQLLAGTVDLLFEVREPVDLMRRFLEHIAEAFRAEAGFVLLRRAESLPELTLFGLRAEDVDRLAAELEAALLSTTNGCRVWRPTRKGEARRWARALGAILPDDGDLPGLVALLSTRPDAFDATDDPALLAILARHAAAAIRLGKLRIEANQQADRLAVQADELERVRRALERHSQEIERSLADRSRFFAAISHELRTPINAVIGYAELLEQGILGELAPAQREAVGKIGASAAQLLALIDDTLDLSKIEAGRMTVRRDRVDLRALVAEAVTGVEVAARKKGLALHTRIIDPLPVVETDPARVRQVLLNLLSNAVKFTEAGSVTLEVRHIPDATAGGASPGCGPGTDGWIAITVDDTGQGIPRDQIERIFGEFVQLPPASGESKGTGLGLAISSRIARLLGGDLTVESEEGVRSTFTFYLPCPAPALPANASTENQGTHATPDPRPAP
mgnify:CR=1 FL=1|jgi:signal transduction histidine kinase